MTSKNMTPAGRKVLMKAASRERGNLCPIVSVNVRAASEMALIEALVRKGYATDNRVPYITEAGRAALATEVAL